MLGGRPLLGAFCFLIVSSPAPSTLALNRTTGPANDKHFEAASKICNASDPSQYQFAACSILIACIYDNLNEGFKASLSSGTNIASLLPTILVLIGSPTLEIVDLAIVSPHRAVAVCCFGLGLPRGLFRLLRPLQRNISESNTHDLRVREWMVFLPSISRKPWQHLAVKLMVDSAIITSVSLMWWRNLVITSFTMVPWRCEYTWLLPAWPIACLIWLFLAFILLLFMKESIQIYDPSNPSIQYTILGLMMLPYRVPPEKRAPSGSIRTSPGSVDGDIGEENAESSLADRSTSQQYEGSPTAEIIRHSYCVTIHIVMPTAFGFRSWRSYETLIETTAVGIYLYATFVLTSLLFLNADKAIGYATTMALMLSIVRILSVLL